MDKSKRHQQTAGDIKYSAPDTGMILIGLLVVFITLVLLYVYKKKKTSRTDILLLGLCEAGKTKLYTLLMGVPDKETFTSIKENVGDFTAKNGFARLVDIPGHERLRGRFVDDYKKHARGAVFIVDSSTIQKDVRDVADFLYTLMADPALSSTPFLILANKQDETMAKGAGVIKSLLEKEMNMVRSTRMRQLESVDDKASQNVFLGRQGKDFEFAHLSQNVEIAESSAVNDDLVNLNDWLDRVV